MSEQPLPWEQLPDEPDIWFARFCLYRSLPPGRRSYDAVWRMMGKRTVPSSSFCKTVARWKWQERIDAYEKWVAEQQVNAAEKNRIEDLPNLIQDTAVKYVRHVNDVLSVDPEKIESVKNQLAIVTTIGGKNRAYQRVLETHKALFGERHKVEVSGDEIWTKLSFPKTA